VSRSSLTGSRYKKTQCLVCLSRHNTTRRGIRRRRRCKRRRLEDERNSKGQLVVLSIENLEWEWEKEDASKPIVPFDIEPLEGPSIITRN
ncbi:hypothetical protein V1477_012629, partial [Vespula maculifrons]